MSIRVDPVVDPNSTPVKDVSSYLFLHSKMGADHSIPAPPLYSVPVPGPADPNCVSYQSSHAHPGG